MKDMGRMGWVAVFSAVSALAVAQGAVTVAKTADEATKATQARQQIFKDMKKANDPLGAMLRNQREIDPAVVAASATQIQSLAGKIAAAYLVDTRQFKDPSTEGRKPGDNVWTSHADFKAKADDLVKAAGALAAVAPGGDKGAIRKAIVDMSKTCGACHDNYTVKL